MEVAPLDLLEEVEAAVLVQWVVTVPIIMVVLAVMELLHQ